jgi:hypothetical protein
MSEVELYAIESKFNDARTEYLSLMKTLQTSCLGKELSTKCQRAAELNAQMQTYLIQMSVLIKKTSIDLPKQQELLNLANQLGQDMDSLDTLMGEREDLNVFANMNYAHALTWSLTALTIFTVLIYQWRK